MSEAVTKEAITEALSTVMEPELHEDLISLNFIRDLDVKGRDVAFTIMLTTPACPLKHVLQEDSERAIRNRVPEVDTISINFDSEVRSDNRIQDKLKLPIKNILAVSSGKGGVGKSTISVNLAVSLAQAGAKTGLLDADIYGPNIPLMMGVEQLPPAVDNKLIPAVAYDVELMSMGFLIPQAEALVWRGPMLHSAIQQLFTEVTWSNLDYLVVDLPPGTGDAQLSLAQLVPLTGGVIVTGPQKVAVSDARRGVSAFKRLEVPILGVIENMSGDLFGAGGGEKVAQELGVDFIGSIGLHREIPQSSDGGVPFVVNHTDEPVSEEFQRIARVLAGKISIIDAKAS